MTLRDVTAGSIRINSCGCGGLDIMIFTCTGGSGINTSICSNSINSI